MRKEGILLKNHAQSAFMHGLVGDLLVVEMDTAVIRHRQPSNDAQQRRFATAAWPQQHANLPRRQRQVNIVQHLVVIKRFLDVGALQ